MRARLHKDNFGGTFVVASGSVVDMAVNPITGHGVFYSSDGSLRMVDRVVYELLPPEINDGAENLFDLQPNERQLLSKVFMRLSVEVIK